MGVGRDGWRGEGTHLGELEPAREDFADEEHGRVLRLLVEVAWGAAQHACRYRLRTLQVPSDTRRRDSLRRRETHLRTRTDHPRLAGSEPNVSSSDERICAVRVLESAAYHLVSHRGLQVLRERYVRTCEPKFLEVLLVRDWAVRDAVHKRAQHRASTSFVHAQDIWPRSGRCRRVVGIRVDERYRWIRNGWDADALRVFSGRAHDERLINGTARDIDETEAVYKYNSSFLRL